MLPNPVSVGLLAFILFIAISEHCLQAGGRQGKHAKREEGTSSSGHSGTHTSAHEEHAGPSDPESVQFWKKLDKNMDITGYHFRSLVMVEDGGVECFGSLVMLDTDPSNSFSNIKVIVPWDCWKNTHWDYAKVITIHNKAPIYVVTDEPMKFKVHGRELAILNVLNNDVENLKPVRLAKPNIPFDGTVFGFGVHQDGSIIRSHVIDKKECGDYDESLAEGLAWFCAWDHENSEAGKGSPFFIKSSGEWYLAGIRKQYMKAREDGDHQIHGGNVYTFVHDKLAITAY